MATLYGQLTEHARLVPGREALVDDALSITFGDLPALIAQYQSCLLAAGLTPGATVGLSIKREIPHLLATLALFNTPAHQVTLASFDTDTYCDHLIERLNVSHVLRLGDAMDPLAPRASQFHLRKLDKPFARETVLRDATIYFTTSGTTIGPRIIATTEELLYARGVRHKNIRLQRVLMTPSIEYGVAKRRRMLSLCMGSTSLFYQRPGSRWQQLASFVSDREVTFLQLSPLDASIFVHDAKPVDVPIYITGARIPWPLRKAIQRNLSRDFNLIYGASECGVIAMAEPD